MTRSPRIPAKVFAAILASFATTQAFAGATVTLSPTVGHPKANVNVSGTGFTPDEAIDVYFDTTDTQLVFADDSGNFSARKLKVPADAEPGAHWISAVGRTNGDGNQKAFAVHTDWAAFGFDERGKRTNGFENVLDTHSARSLDLLWKFQLGAVTHSSPTVAKGIVYIGANDGNLHALVAATGVEKWVAQMGDQVYAAPTVSDGVVYVGAWNGKLSAFNAYTGAVKWTMQTPVGGLLGSATVANGMVYVGSAAHDVYAFDAATGAPRWSQSTAGSVYSSPAVVGGTLYVGSTDHKFYAFDALTGAPKWNYQTGDSVDSSAAVANGSVYFTSSDGKLYASDTSGTITWAASMGLVFSSPAVASNTVYAGGYDGNFRAFNATNGAALWTTYLGGYVNSCAAVANGVVYVGSAAGRIYGLDAATGAVLWSAIDGDLAGTSPAVADGIVYISSSDGNLYAYAIDGGRNGVYHRGAKPPSYAALHPDFRLKASH